VTDQVPSELVAGDTWAWTRDLSDYPAGTWTLTYYLRKDDKLLTVVAGASGTTHSVSVLAATTAAYPAGRYKLQARVVNGAISYTLDDEARWVDVLPNPAAAGNSDPRSWAARTLAAVEAFLEGNATTAQASMSINGRAISRWTLAELRQWRDQLRGEVRAEEQGANAGLGRDIKVRLLRA
jgi:hypothetical protein